MTKPPSYPQRAIAVVSSTRFFWVVVALLVLQAVWIAMVGLYPMAFDEEFHLGIIKLYAHHLSPFWQAHPAGADAFGAVTRDPSYLYHYLMSFPYRLISAVTDSLFAQVLILRAINIAFFAGFLVLTRRLLLQTGASRAIVHGCLLLFVLIPVVPLLASQINYDNAWLPLTAGILLLVVKFMREMRASQPIDAQLLFGLVGLCLLASLVKYAFLPIFIAIVIVIIAQFIITFKKLNVFWSNLKKGVLTLRSSQQVLLILLLLVSGGLFAERYGVNVVKYHAPVADCGQVLTVKQCSAYGPWNRDYKLALSKDKPTKGPIYYGKEWTRGMWRRLYFTLAGPTVGYQTRDPFPIPSAVSQLFAVSSLVLLAVYGRRLLGLYNKPVLLLLGTVTICYVGILWVDNYKMYVHTGVPVAVNGRYLLPILPFVMVMGALAMNELLKRRIQLKLLVASLAVLSLMWGGGVLTYILRSNDSWYWPNSPLRGVNHAAQDTLGPLTPDYGDDSGRL